MSDGEDWFERALQETDGADGEDAAGGEADGRRTDSDGERSGGGGADVDGTDARGVDDETDVRGTDARRADDGAVERGGDDTPGRPGREEATGGTADSPPGTGRSRGGWDGVTPAGDDTGPGRDSNGASPFDQDFAAALESAPSPGDFGGDAFGAGGFDGGSSDAPFGAAESFDDEEFESDIERTEIGIEGLDDMILGGVPERSLMVAVGSAGTGKTTFGLQFLEHALADGGTGVFITLEETRERILDTAEEKGWPFRTYEEEERLAIIDLDPVEMADSLTSIRNDLPRLIEAFDADRLVLDSVSLLEMMYDHPARRRSEVFNFSRSLKEAGITTMLTSEASGDNPYQSRYGIVEYLADAVFVLQYVRPSNFQETRLAIEIQKIRDANHSRETKPYEITNDGISVYRRANIF